MSDLWRHLSRRPKADCPVRHGRRGRQGYIGSCPLWSSGGRFFCLRRLVRGQYFHGKQVMSYAQVQQKYDDFIVLLSFATSRAEVIEQILSIANERELYAPDVPVFGDQLFDGAFYEQHKSKIEQTRALLADERSKEIYDQVIEYKLTGKLGPPAAERMQGGGGGAAPAPRSLSGRMRFRRLHRGHRARLFGPLPECAAAICV